MIPPVSELAWKLRAATEDDRAMLFEVHCVAMRPYVEATWGWDDEEQARMFAERFRAAAWQVVTVGDETTGMLSIEESQDEIWLASIEIHPRFQGRGLGTAIVRSLLTRSAKSGKPLTLRVLHANHRARALYERLGFKQFREIETHVYFRARPPRT
jgi:ribosomal protein S18 acetylase RimI-like enzyme